MTNRRDFIKQIAGVGMIAAMPNSIFSQVKKRTLKKR